MNIIIQKYVNESIWFYQRVKKYSLLFLCICIYCFFVLYKPVCFLSHVPILCPILFDRYPGRWENHNRYEVNCPCSHFSLMLIPVFLLILILAFYSYPSLSLIRLWIPYSISCEHSNFSWKNCAYYPKYRNISVSSDRRYRSIVVHSIAVSQYYVGRVKIFAFFSVGKSSTKRHPKQNRQYAETDYIKNPVYLLGTIEGKNKGALLLLLFILRIFFCWLYCSYYSYYLYCLYAYIARAASPAAIIIHNPYNGRWWSKAYFTGNECSPRKDGNTLPHPLAG